MPQYLALIVKDIIRYRGGDLVTGRCKNIQQQRKSKNFIGVHYNRGIEMINVAGIIHSKVVRDTIQLFFSNKETLVVSYKYSNQFSVIRIIMC